MGRVAVCCSVLQCVAVCCRVLQCVAVCCIVLPCVAVCSSVLHWVYQQRHELFELQRVRGRGELAWYLCCSVAVCCSCMVFVLQCDAACFGVLQCVSMCCSVLQCIAVSKFLITEDFYVFFPQLCQEIDPAREVEKVCYSVLQRVAVCCSVV